MLVSKWEVLVSVFAVTIKSQETLCAKQSKFVICKLPLLESGSLSWQVCRVLLHQSWHSIRVELDQTVFHLPTSQSGAQPVR